MVYIVAPVSAVQLNKTCERDNALVVSTGAATITTAGVGVTGGFTADPGVMDMNVRDSSDSNGVLNFIYLFLKQSG